MTGMLFDMPANRADPRGMVEQTRATIEALREAGVLGNEHSATVQLALQLSLVFDNATLRGGKEYGLANVAAQIQSTLDRLPTIPPKVDRSAHPWLRFEDEMRQEYERARRASLPHPA